MESAKRRECSQAILVVEIDAIGVGNTPQACAARTLFENAFPIFKQREVAPEFIHANARMSARSSGVMRPTVPITEA